MESEISVPKVFIQKATSQDLEEQLKDIQGSLTAITVATNYIAQRLVGGVSPEASVNEEEDSPSETHFSARIHRENGSVIRNHEGDQRTFPTTQTKLDMILLQKLLEKQKPGGIPDVSILGSLSTDCHSFWQDGAFITFAQGQKDMESNYFSFESDEWMIPRTSQTL
jgi:hypothetical protein